MKKVKHWLHILLTLLTGGLWLPVYVIVIATTEMFNRGYREGKAAGRVEKSNEYEAEIDAKVEDIRKNGAGYCSFLDTKGRRVIVGADGDMRFGCTMAPVVPFDGPQVTVHREKVVGVDGATYGFVETIESSGAKIQHHITGEKSRVDRFAELADRNRSVGLDAEERREYFALRTEVVR
jgi:carbon monoxide dehydrogenase subunit G